MQILVSFQFMERQKLECSSLKEWLWKNIHLQMCTHITMHPKSCDQEIGKYLQEVIDCRCKSVECYFLWIHSVCVHRYYNLD